MPSSYKTATLVVVLATFLICTLLGKPGASADDMGIGEIVFPPTGNETYNFWDNIWVTYNSPWIGGVNLSGNCLPRPDVNESEGFLYPRTFAEIPINQTGSYMFHELGVKLSFAITEFPVICWFGLGPYAVNDLPDSVSYNDYPMQTLVRAGNFSMTSDEGVAATDRRPSMTGPSSTTSITAATASSTNTTMPASIITVVMTRTSSPVTAVASVTSSMPPDPFKDLSSGDKAGIFTGTGIAVVLLASIVFVMARRRNRQLENAGVQAVRQRHVEADQPGGEILQIQSNQGRELDGADSKPFQVRDRAELEGPCPKPVMHEIGDR